MDPIVASSPQKLTYYGEDVLAYSNPELYDHHITHNMGSHPVHNVGGNWTRLSRNPMVSQMPNQDPLCPNPYPVSQPNSGLPKINTQNVARSRISIPQSHMMVGYGELEQNEFESGSSSPGTPVTVDTDPPPDGNIETPSLLPTDTSTGESGKSMEPNTANDFRRFSSRHRKRTDFFGVLDGRNRNRNRKRRRKHKRSERNSQRPSKLARRLVYVRSKIQEEEQQQSSPYQGVTDVPPLENSPSEDQGVADVSPAESLPSEDQRVADVEDISPPDSLPSEDQEVTDVSPPQTTTTTLMTKHGKGSSSSLKNFPSGRMMWGKLPGYEWWPGCILSSAVGEDGTISVWIKWYGENLLSQITSDKLIPYEEFNRCFNPLHMKGLYRKANFAALKEAARRCKKEFASDPNDKRVHLKLTEDSAASREKKDPSASSSSAPSTVSQDSDADNGEAMEVDNLQQTKASPLKRGRKGAVTFTKVEEEIIDWAKDGFLPMGPAALLPALEDQMDVEVIELPDETKPAKSGKSRKKKPEPEPKACFKTIAAKGLDISKVCISCGSYNVSKLHPLFEGGLCEKCKNIFLECAYMFDYDGSQMYCSICCGGVQVFMCDAESCSKVYCTPCIEKLCGEAEVQRVRETSGWICYMCCPTYNRIGLLRKREDWDYYLRALFLNDQEENYECVDICRSIKSCDRRPIRVLSLFDGIGTACLVLKDLGIVIEKYLASEIDDEAISVCRIQHDEMVHLGDITKITEKQIRELGPFDLLIGGSPCNDLSIVNPARKGIYGGTGRLFFEFFRIYTYLRPMKGENRLFFWLYENVVSMRQSDKRIICRFMQCNPVVADAREISPAHRARYFWGNLPGMNRPLVPLPGDRLALQQCLEKNCDRIAQFDKLRTITTKMNSIKQTKNSILPVWIKAQNEGDVLWCTEMERLFGFPDHYTDVCNLGRSGRQRLLGKSWCVPVIRHFLSPLKDYFQSNTTMDHGNSTANAHSNLPGPSHAQ